MNKWNIVTCNESGDYYVIPLDKRDEWIDYIEMGVYEDNAKPPTWAIYVGGFPEDVKFKEFEGRWSLRNDE